MYAVCEIENKELLTNWLTSRNCKPFDSLGFDSTCTEYYMNIKAKIQNNTTITYAKPTAKDTRITGSTKIGFMPDGKYVTKGKTVDDVLANVTREYIKRQKQIKKKAITTADLLDDALAYKQKRNGVKDATIKIDRQNYENFVRGSKLEAMPIKESADIVAIEEFVYDELVPRYQARRKDHSLPTTSDVNKKLTVLREIMTYAFRKGYITMNPFMTDKLRLRGVTAKPKAKKPEDSIYTKEQTQLIINHCENTYLNGRNHNSANIAVILIIFTGIRAGECGALKWSDCYLNAEVPYIHIERQEDNAHNITDVKCDSDAGRRNVPLPPQAVDLLKMLRKNTKVFSEWVFAHADGTRVTKHQIASALNNAIEHEPSIKKSRVKELTHSEKPIVASCWQAIHHCRQCKQSWDTKSQALL